MFSSSFPRQNRDSRPIWQDAESQDRVLGEKASETVQSAVLDPRRAEDETGMMASMASVASAAALGGSARRRDARALRASSSAAPRRARLRSSPTVRAGMEVHQADTRVVDFYELLGVPEDADIKTIKRAYYDLALYCHPDRSGDDGHDLCVVLNDAYAILKDPVQREAYDAELAVQREDDLDEFTGKAYSKWTTRKAAPGETRAVFVDEFTCIGCKQCVWAAPATFRMEDEHGRSRVYAQWLNSEEDIDCAIASCPVDCIHWVEKEQLPYLEHVTRFVDKVSVGIMQSGQGRTSVTDPFDAAYAYQKFRERKIEQRRLKLEEERRNREWAEANAREKEAKAGGDDAAAGSAGGASDPDAFSRRRDYGKTVGRIKETWAAGTGVKMETMKRRRWADSGATIPIERALVPLAEVERMNAESEKVTVTTSR